MRQVDEIGYRSAMKRHVAVQEDAASTPYLIWSLYVGLEYIAMIDLCVVSRSTFK